jgi:multiple sugar transport system substrate-binding protein
MGADDKNFGGDQTVALWNKAHPTEKITIKLLPDNVSDMHTALVDLFSHQSSTYDMISGDIIWAAEFGSKGWIDELNPAEFDTASAYPSTVDGLIYKHKLYGVPWVAVIGAFYYRKDLVPNPPTSWAEMIAICAQHPNISCYDGQFAAYEGLSVNVEEAIYSAGGNIIDAAGKVVINSPESLRALEFLSNGFKVQDKIKCPNCGYIPASYITHNEGISANEFKNGKVLFLRDWNFFYKDFAGTDSKVKDKFGVIAPVGLVEHGFMVPGETPIQLNHWAHHKTTAQDFMRFAISYPVQRMDLDAQTFPVNTAVYDAPDALKAHPEIALWKSSYIASRPRPVIPRYSDVSQVIYTETFKMLQGNQPTIQGKTIEQVTLDSIDRQLKKIVGS